MPILDTESKFRGQSLVGQKFNRLTVVGYAGKDLRLDPHWECLCDCGKVKVIGGKGIKGGTIKSCGCWQRESCLIRMTLEEKTERFWRKVDKSGDCWMWTGKVDENGYGRFQYENISLAHRFAWFIEFGSLPDKPYICHRCDRPGCVRVLHLFEGTAYDNNHDAIAKGRMRHWGCPISTPELVIEIRRLYATGKFTYPSLSKRFNIPETRIFSALNKWKTLPLYV